MIVWDEIKYDVERAKKDYSNLNISSFNEGGVVDKTYLELREDLIKIRDDVFDEYNLDTVEKLGYNFDLNFGLKMYQLLNNKYQFNSRYAAKDDVWRFMQLKIIPDIVSSRWGNSEERFYNSSRRIWLKTLWWYIHLSWMESEEDTYNILKNNTTDTIMNLVERPGLGYNVELFRHIMKKYGELGNENNIRQIFRRVLVLNTARLQTITPELYVGGVKGYVDKLYQDVLN